MMKNKQESRKQLHFRLVTAVVGLPIVWWLLIKASSRAFLIAVIIFNFIAAAESVQLCCKQQKYKISWWIAWIIAVVLYFHFGDKIANYPIAVFIWTLAWQLPILLLWIFGYQKQNQQQYNMLRSLTLLLALIPLPWILVKIHFMLPGWLLFVFLLVWSGDTAAYFVGRKYPYGQLAPSLSPNKTLSGFVGQFLLIFLVTSWLGPYLISDLMLEIGQLPFSILTALTSLLGDLFFSWHKRCAQQKNTGAILPGHGGLLDRIDGLIGFIPWFYCGLLFYAHA